MFEMYKTNRSVAWTMCGDLLRFIFLLDLGGGLKNTYIYIYIHSLEEKK